ncbi:hypothetical protein FE257_000348 [Aspergillus nanangensis]|uniref:PH domain-containing protein n=1 Tax=Aspergillus nanangensis TaxID=2582783 RepID=A0AAD4D168_ASPNN|nr:hypothetical protein FE257_000348 [Aspergillus nanangensis]
MSDAQKPVEETPVAAPADTTPAVDAAAPEVPAKDTPVEAPKETTAESSEAAPTEEAKKDETEQPKEEAKEEVKPASEGVLGYKAPGLVKGLRFSKRFFYFSDDAVESKNLAAYKQNEKPAVANPTVAWATQTGKGLLFLVKRAEDKATPAGILNLAEISEVTKEGTNEFLFKINGHKHTFQAANAAERDSWVAAVEAKSTEAKAEKETITSSEGYKAELEKTKPVVPKPAEKPAEPKEEAKEEAAPAEAKEEAKEEAAPVESKEKAKSRSQSRKRASIFGISLGKKEEPEEKKEKTEEAKPAEASTEAPAEAAKAPEAAEVAPAVEAAAPVEAAESAEKKDEDKTEETEKKEEEKKSKRASIFGNFFQKVTSPSQEKTEKEAAAPVETPAVASTAPQLDNPVEGAAGKPIEPESVTAPAEGEAPKEAEPAQSPAVETPTATKEKRRTSFFGNLGKKKGDSDNEAEGEAKPKANKLGSLFRKPSKAVKSEPKEATATETETKAEGAPKEATVEESAAEESAKPAEAPATEEAKSVNVATSTPVQAAA